MRSKIDATGFSIGTLARETGTSAQLLRHYDALGLLRPSRTAARYRRYSEEDRARLGVIRALRELDVDLRTIARMLAGSASWRSIAELHLRALEHQERIVRRRAAVLRASLRGDAPLDISRLERLQRLARLDHAEKTAFVSAELSRRLPRNTPPRVRRAVDAVAAIEPPDDPTPEQLDAWLELAELVSDPGFLAHYERQSAPEITTRARTVMDRVQRDVLTAIDRGVEPHHREARPLVRRWLQANARGRRAADHRAAGRDFLRRIDSGRHAAEGRFWELMAVLKPELRRHPAYVAMPWIIRGIRVWFAG